MNDKKKQWRARVVLTLRTQGDDGQIADIAPGEYTLSECDGARYQLIRHAGNPTYLSIWFAELLFWAYRGQLEILGVWP